jgi:transglutaminase-like putative cysteine protease
MRYRIRHLTRYDYAEVVTLSQNLAHLAPRSDGRVLVTSYRLEVEPGPSMVRARIDYFGNRTDAFVITAPHRQLMVTSHAEVQVLAPAPPSPELTPPWDGSEVQGGGTEVDAWEFRFDSTLIPCAADLAAYARPDFTPSRPILAAALALTIRMHREFAYDPSATTAATPVLDALELRRGVCQDFAQVLIGCLRTLGIPARYVSGYLETIPPPGRPRLVGADATHAWVQAWCGAVVGWVDLDPTNACIPGDRHIPVAYGRDFSDVSPLKGMVLGGGRAEVTVGVDVEPVDGHRHDEASPASSEASAPAAIPVPGSGSHADPADGRPDGSGV